MKLRFLDRFEEFCKQKRLLKLGDTIIIGCSGGSDSMALLLALYQLKMKYRLSIIVAHVNYNLRGEDSKEDLEFVKRFCFDYNLCLVVNEVRIEKKSGIEAEARKIRFEYFNKIAELYNADKIALGHHKEDQVETIIFRFFRGSGLTGLRGILPIADQIIHPLLMFSKQEIKDYLKDEGITWRVDKSNDSLDYTRNKIRHQMIPWIQENLNTNVLNSVYQEGLIFSKTEKYMMNTIDNKFSSLLLKHKDHEYRFSLDRIKKLPDILRFYLYRKVYYKISSENKDFYQNNFLEIEKILFSNGSKLVILPNEVKVRKEYKELIFYLEEENKNVEKIKEIASVRSPFLFGNFRIKLSKIKKIPENKFLFANKFTVYLDMENIVFPLTFRYREPGDKFIPFGMMHKKKVKDFFIDEKVPKYDRDKVIIVSDSEKIIWIAGYRVDQRVALKKESKKILQISMEKAFSGRPRSAERKK